ncbi:GNAT family N-acetyltransferase [Pantoea sp. Tr-811]|uniref:GNAT family N-acetyltransferase n=1 Tax=unclassified Pantoea TaxID=2630326 RepID=UPI001421FB07|nr:MULTISPECIES: GNAT family N-acetyltransferase [unclassified Pantoea]NIE78517.1 GNAT family N-acetyltransferase [Pantoea sp. Ap-967]NIF25150.1 GNAT family N-acetyltransferase [Pantoea sp. Tr-811]
MRPTLTLRKAQPADVEAITALVQAAYSPYIERIGKAPAPMLDDYRQVLADCDVQVAVQGLQVVGVLVMECEGEQMLLANVAVLPACKGQGIGKALMTFCETHALQAGCKAVRLYTHERMTENIEIYHKLGYVETHRAEEQGFARVFMRKAL